MWNAALMVVVIAKRFAPVLRLKRGFTKVEGCSVDDMDYFVPPASVQRSTVPTRRSPWASWLVAASIAAWNLLLLCAFGVLSPVFAILVLVLSVSFGVFAAWIGPGNLPAAPLPWLPPAVPSDTGAADFPTPSHLNNLGTWLSVRLIPCLLLPFVWPGLVVQRLLARS